VLFDFVRPRRKDDTDGSRQRYAAVVELLETDAKRAAEVRHHVLRLLSSRRLVGAFAESGILPDTGFFTELGRLGWLCRLAAVDPVSPASPRTS